MKKFYLPIAILMMAVLLGTTACSPAVTAPTVKFALVAPEYKSFDSVDLTTGFDVNNPNEVPIVVSSLSYTLTVNGILLANKNITPMTYIPAKSNGTVSVLNVITYVDVITQYVLTKSMDSGTAAFAFMPLWKLIGGPSAFPLWISGVGAALATGPAVSDLSNPDKIPDALKAYGTAKGTFDAVQAGIAKAFTAAPAGPTTYKAKGSMTIMAGSQSLDVPFDLEYTVK